MHTGVAIFVYIIPIILESPVNRAAIYTTPTISKGIFMFEGQPIAYI